MNDGLKATSIVIFGASGDLTSRKLIPALYNLYRRQRLPPNFRIVGFARRPYSHDDFRELMFEALQDSRRNSIRRSGISSPSSSGTRVAI